MIVVNAQTLIPLFQIGFLNLEDYTFRYIYNYFNFFRCQNDQFKKDVKMITNQNYKFNDLVDQNEILQQYEIPYSMQLQSAQYYNMIFNPIQQNYHILTPLMLISSIFAPVVSSRVFELFFITRGAIYAYDAYQIKNYKTSSVKQDDYKKFMLNSLLNISIAICCLTPLYKMMKFNAIQYQKKVTKDIILKDLIK